MFAVLAHATVFVHFVALLYIGLGGFLAWRWPRSIFLHLLFAAWGVIVNVTSAACPLTSLENFFRAKQGLGPLPGGFNEYYIFGEILPTGYIGLAVAVGVAALVTSYAGVYIQWRNRKSTSRMVPVK
ncbi:DUF2784 domain-containing protein [Actinokineospora sp. NBRC 105648]|uniref:DUF2784 domain-containing protein n=1 Tax=Actinokineospora sp. NBRC 105648 TaxID=3032206 RepID=UPI0024A17358|nr:DUF2784 domain-containing protein [Actinokineospora sp. NBRC 105648]GLZ37541.1 hypothetical protein Acsp05_11660 [Actinokineospora sp. NBRC 105648]